MTLEQKPVFQRSCFLSHSVDLLTVLVQNLNKHVKLRKTILGEYYLLDQGMMQGTMGFLLLCPCSYGELGKGRVLPGQ